MSIAKRSKSTSSSKVVKPASARRRKNPAASKKPAETLRRVNASTTTGDDAGVSKRTSTKMAKHRVTVTLDPDVVEFLQASAGQGSMSAVLNDFMRDEMERHQQREAMQQFLDEQETLHGPVDAELVAEAEALLA